MKSRFRKTSRHGIVHRPVVAFPRGGVRNDTDTQDCRLTRNAGSRFRAGHDEVLGGIANIEAGGMYPTDGTNVADFFSYQAYESLRRNTAGRAQIAAYQYSRHVSITFPCPPGGEAERTSPVTAECLYTARRCPRGS